MDIKILIATHKQLEAPQDTIYLPVHVGKEGKSELGYTGDNTGDNISLKNPYYCELTALYWAWKNLETDYIGLVHYRRFLSYKHKSNIQNSILKRDDIAYLCKKYDIILPPKRHYIIETVHSHYAHTHYIEHLNITRQIIKETYPNYLESFDKVMARRSAHMFNMFIMKKELVDKYCEWLFNILFRLSDIVDCSKLSPFQARIPARIGELLLDVWITKNKHLYKEVNYVHIGHINWIKKIPRFLMAKFIGKKLTESC
jgi:hypothetical protein